MPNPRVIDHDDGNITVELNGEELRVWGYDTSEENRFKIRLAREYVEGWCNAVRFITTGKTPGEEDL